MTVNKLTYPAKENAVQEKINEIIDNLGTNITVDQTYDGTSANPQSGVAIAGAGFLTGINSTDVTTALDYTPADNTLSNVSSIDSNSAVQTALNGKADTSLSNLSATGKTVIDGQWISASEDIISSSTSLNGSTAIPKRVATIPNNGYIYEGIFRARAETGTTSGNVIRVQLTGNVLGNGFYVGSARTRSASAVECQGTVIIPIKGVASNSTNLNIARSTNNTGNLVSLTLIGYRRLGTNN